MEISNLAKMSESEFAGLEKELVKHGSLGQILAWANRAPDGVFLPQIVAETIAQDEYTHDIIIPYKEYFLVFDTT